MDVQEGCDTVGQQAGGEGSGCVDGQNIHRWILDPESMIYEVFPDSDHREFLANKTPEQLGILKIRLLAQFILHQANMSREMDKLVMENAALKDSNSQLQRASDADKKKIRDLEEKLDSRNLESNQLLEDNEDKEKDEKQLEVRGQASGEKRKRLWRACKKSKCH